MTAPVLATTADVRLWYGPVTADEFENSPESSKPALLVWLASLRTMTDAEFRDACETAIYDSASAGRFAGNFSNVHCRATACFNESRRRLVLAGHSDDCRGPSIYSRAHASLMREHGYRPTADGTCKCFTGEAP
jgi:hypothetical protein